MERRSFLKLLTSVVALSPLSLGKNSTQIEQEVQEIVKEIEVKSEEKQYIPPEYSRIDLILNGITLNISEFSFTPNYQIVPIMTFGTNWEDSLPQKVISVDMVFTTSTNITNEIFRALQDVESMKIDMKQHKSYYDVDLTTCQVELDWISSLLDLDGVCHTDINLKFYPSPTITRVNYG